MNLPLTFAAPARSSRKELAVRAGRSVTALLALFLMLAGCANGEEKKPGEPAEDEAVKYKIGDPVADSTIAAIVTSEYGTDTLRSDQFRSYIMMAQMQYPQIGDDNEQMRELRRNIVDQFIIEHLVVGEAKRQNLTVDPIRVDQEIGRMRQQAGTEEAFQQFLTANGMTEDTLRSRIRQALPPQLVLERLADSAKTPTTQELETFRQERAQQIRASHILFLTRGIAQAKQDSVRLAAEAVLDSVKSGATFADLARRHSGDRASAAQGGDLGFFGRGQMVPSFEKAGFALADSGDVTQELVKSPFGYHIIQLTGRRTDTPMDTTAARQMFMEQRRNEAVKAGIDQLRGKVTVRLNDKIVDADINARPEDE